MAALIKKTSRAKKMMGTREYAKRTFGIQVRKAKLWCEKNGFELKSHSNAQDYDICILSRSEYDLEAYRKDVEEQESYFLTEDAYERWKEDS